MATAVFSTTELTMTRDSRGADGFGDTAFQNGQSQRSEIASDGTGLSRRRFVGAAAFAASQVGLLGLYGRLDAMTEKTVGAGGQSDSERVEIRPFHVSVSDAELSDLRRRINMTRWPDRELVADATQGVQLQTVQKLARYWALE